jgi:hypothetical protein
VQLKSVQLRLRPFPPDLPHNFQLGTLSILILQPTGDEVMKPPATSGPHKFSGNLPCTKTAMLLILLLFPLDQRRRFESTTIMSLWWLNHQHFQQHLCTAALHPIQRPSSILPTRESIPLRLNFALYPVTRFSDEFWKKMWGQMVLVLDSYLVTPERRSTIPICVWIR